MPITHQKERDQLTTAYQKEGYDLIELYALKDYSSIWYKTINILLRNGEDGLTKYFENNIASGVTKGAKHFRNFTVDGHLLEQLKEDIRPKSPSSYIKPTIDKAIKSVKLRIQYIDSAFLYNAPRTDKKMIVFRGKSDDYYNPARSLNTGKINIDTGYISTTTNIKVALRFIKNYKEVEETEYNTDDEEERRRRRRTKKNEEGGEQPCCLYRMHIMEGIPHIDMSHLSRFNTEHNKESEILLPRDLKITIIESDRESKYLSHKHKVKIIDIKVEKNTEDQFDVKEKKNLKPYDGFLMKSEDTEPVGGNRRIKRRTNKLKNTHKRRTTKRRTTKRRITKRRITKRRTKNGH